ncbi:hypothetical protein, partial [Streptococcus orisratti]|uniref:hypothetical protein n=1 Tax=Streptococcus orisratti TaxID=114652 RepID=UPI0023F8330C
NGVSSYVEVIKDKLIDYNIKITKPITDRLSTKSKLGQIFIIGINSVTCESVDKKSPTGLSRTC